ncbi:hypothetical protein ACFQ15_17100 [Sphingomonas hankookensis]|uniref:hypothetical protein n=1 Tax=Sphingomonas hankookensis TaxID=563996 RepID=UPI001F57A213|nr:hypothetical protein [Sphingomonas hankookensis]
MKLNVGAAIQEALAIWRRDRDVIVAVAGVFFFLPNLALSLFMRTDRITVRAGTQDDQALLASMQSYLVDNIHWLALQALAELVGIAVLLALILDPARPTVGEALRTAFRRLPVLVVATLLINAAKLGGLILFILPMLYVIGRVFVVLPVLMAEPERRFGDAMGRAIELTKGHALQLLSLSGLIFFGGQMVVLLLSATASAVSAGGTNPVTMAILAFAASVVAAAMSIAFTLTRATIYRRLASNG